MGHVNVADWIVAGEFLLFLTALTVFVAYYTVSSHGQWRRSAEGRHMVQFRSALIAFGIMGVVHALVPAYPGRDVVRVAVIGAAALGAVRGATLVIRAQRAARRARTAPPAATRTPGP